MPLADQQQGGETHEPEPARRRRDAREDALEIHAGVLGEREPGEQLVDEIGAEVVVAKHKPEHGREEHEERDEREEDVVGDRRGKLRAPVAKVLRPGRGDRRDQAGAYGLARRSRLRDGPHGSGLGPLPLPARTAYRSSACAPEVDAHDLDSEIAQPPMTP